MYRYILFDLDGTLSDPKQGICTCVQTALSKMGIEEPDIDKLEPFIGPPLRDSFKEFYGMSDEDAEKAIKYYRERFSTVGKYENELYPGIKELLKDLKKKEKILAIASSKPTVFVEDILKYFEIREYFDVVVGSELDGTRDTKEAVLEYTLKQMFPDSEIEYEEVVMIGDRRFDIDAAHKLGVGNIGVSYGYGSREELEEAGADKIVNTVQGLRTTLLPVLNQGLTRTSISANNSEEAQAGGQKRSSSYRNSNAVNGQRSGAVSGKQSFARTWSYIGPVLTYWICTIFFSTFISFLSLFVIPEYAETNSNICNSIIYGIGNFLAAVFVILQEQKNQRRRKTQNKNADEEKQFSIKDYFSTDNISTGSIMYAMAVLLLAIGLTGFFTCFGMWFFAADDETMELYRLNYEIKRSAGTFAGILLYGILCPAGNLIVFLKIVYDNAKKAMRGMFPAILTIVLYSFLISGGYFNTKVEGIWATIVFALLLIVYEKFGNVLVCIGAGVAIFITNWIISDSADNGVLLSYPKVYSGLLAAGLAAFIVLLLLDAYKKREAAKDNQKKQ